MTITSVVLMGTSLLCLAAMYAGGYRMFEKAGEKGWKVFVPILNTYTLFKMVTDPIDYWIRTIVEILMVLNLILLPYLSGTLFIIVAVVVICEISVFVTCHINVIIRLVEAFKCPAICGVGLVFFTGIFSFLLGFGDSEFDKRKATEMKMD